jgi:hypothetical protein
MPWIKYRSAVVASVLSGSVFIGHGRCVTMHPLMFHSFSYVECLAGNFFSREALIFNHVIFIPLLKIAFKGSGKEDS